jgi:Tfp pilus assembly protein PilO
MNLGLRTQRTIYLIFIGLILLSVPVHFLFVRPEIEADEGEKTRDESARLEVRKRTAVLLALKGMENKIMESRRSYAKFTEDYLFSREKGSSELLQNLDLLCTQAGLQRNRSTFKHDEEPEFGMRRVSFTLPIEGSYTSIRKFLNMLENGSKFIIVDSMALDSEREGTGLIRMEMRLLTLFGGKR